jgi:hypothetical protein
VVISRRQQQAGEGGWGRGADAAGGQTRRPAWAPTALPPPPPPPPPPQVACSSRHAALVTRSGEVYTWGFGQTGCLGHGMAQHTAAPCPVSRLRRQGSFCIAASEHSTAAITAEGQLYTWGQGAAGSLGHGDRHRCTWPARVMRNLEQVGGPPLRWCCPCCWRWPCCWLAPAPASQGLPRALQPGLGLLRCMQASCRREGVAPGRGAGCPGGARGMPGRGALPPCPGA